MALQAVSMQGLQQVADAAVIGVRESSFLPSSSTVSSVQAPCRIARQRRRKLRVAGQGAATHMPSAEQTSARAAARAAVATRRRALFGYGAVMALGHVTAAAVANPAGTKLATQGLVRNEALQSVKKLQKAGCRSFKGLRNGLATMGSRSFKEVKSFAKAGTQSFRGLRRTISRAGSQTLAELTASLDHAGAAVKSNVEGAAHRVEETVRSRVHEVVGKLGDVSEDIKDIQMECADKVEDAKASAISEFADLVEDAGDAVKFLRWASEMYQTVSAVTS